MKYKLGDKVRVNPENDNEGYKDFKDKTLIIVHADNKGFGYDKTVYPQGLYCFETLDGETINSSLYDYELVGVEE